MQDLSKASKSIPEVSVLVTVYNRQEFLPECLDSILASTWQDFEVIVVDDCSSDSSVEIAEAYAKRDNRIRFFQNEKNLGDYGNRNRAASLARGEFLKYLDADDLIYPHGLYAMVSSMREFPEAGFGLCHHDRNPSIPFPFQSSPQQVISDHFLRQSVLGRGPSASIIRREHFEAVGGFSGQQFIGDAELWMKLAEVAPVVSLVPALVWWRVHPGQQIKLESSQPEIFDKRFHLDLDSIEATKHLSPEEKKSATDRVLQHHARKILSIAIRQRLPSLAFSLFRQSRMSLRNLGRGLFPYLR